MPNRSVKLVLYFDEAHELTEGKIRYSPDDKTLYDVLLSVLNEYRVPPLFVLFLSTLSDVAHFSPPRDMFRSARAADSDAHQAPITETPFDCYPDLLIEQDAYDLLAVSRIKFMARFGRPLYVCSGFSIRVPTQDINTISSFWTMLKHLTGNALEDMCDHVVHLARAKLVGRQKTDAPPDSFSDTALLAVVDVRLCLEYQPLNSQLALHTQADLVAHHMRLAYSVPKHRYYFRSGYSSEPILAEVSIIFVVLVLFDSYRNPQAATRQLNVWRKSNRTILIDVLTKHMSSNLLDRGERGEVVARALIVEAYDRATLRCRKHNSKDPLSMGCGVIEFVEELFRDHAIVTESYPDNIMEGGRHFKDEFKGAQLRITHFARSGDDHVVKTESMAPAFIRGTAFVCRRNEQTIDIILPLLLWDAKICEWVTSGFFIQVKD